MFLWKSWPTFKIFKLIFFFFLLSRSFCVCTGIQIAIKEYNFDMKNRGTFSEEDILNIFPVAKHINPRVCLVLASFFSSFSFIHSGINLRVCLAPYFFFLSFLLISLMKILLSNLEMTLLLRSVVLHSSFSSKGILIEHTFLRNKSKIHKEMLKYSMGLARIFVFCYGDHYPCIIGKEVRFVAR